MPIETRTVVNIVCDNPACPGNDLDPASYEGWLQINAQMHQDSGSGMMMPVFQSFVFCSASCLAAFSSDEETSIAPPIAQPPIPVGPPIEEEATP